MRVFLERRYLSFIERKERGIFGDFFFIFLFFLSLIFRFSIFLRNLFYERGLFKVYKTDKKVISVGNLTWGGTGKTSMVLYLYKRLHLRGRVAILTKGYAKDEYSLLKDIVKDVFDARDRVKTVRNLLSLFEIFILDDGFQYRRLARNLDIVLLRKDSLEKVYLIPAGEFREPLKSLQRADIVIITYCEPEQIEPIKKILLKIKNSLQIFCADYRGGYFLNRKRERFFSNYFVGRKVGVLTAIGYPQGFLKKLKEIAVEPSKVMIYPDHYSFSPFHLAKIEKEFLKEGINQIIVTFKDYFHLPLENASLDYFIFIPEFKVYNEEEFFKVVEDFLGN